MRKSIPLLLTAIIAFGLSCSEKITEQEKPAAITLSITPVALTKQAPAEVFCDASVHGGTPPYSWSWSFGDNAVSDQEHPVHSYATAGTFRIIAQVTSSDGQTIADTSSIAILAHNALSAAAISVPPRGQLPFTSVLFAQAAGGREPYSYKWMLSEGHAFSQSQNPEFTPTSPGATQFILEITSADNQSARDTIQIVASNEPVTNMPPVISMQVTPTAGQRDSTRIVCSAEGTRDIDGKVQSLIWDFGDGQTAQGTRAEHIYHAVGLYRIQLTATDDSAASSTEDRYVRIDSLSIRHNQMPLAAIDLTPVTGMVDSTIFSFSGIRSKDADGTITKYAWDFGDGTSANRKEAAHRYAQTGLYRVILQVTDDSNAVNMTDVFVQVNAPVQKRNQPPIAVLSVAPPNGRIDSTVFVCSSEGSYDPDGKIIRWNWNFGDNTTAQGNSAYHVYRHAGIYRILLEVVDDSNAIGSAYTFVTVDSMLHPINWPPIVRASVLPTNGIVHVTEFAFDASKSTDDWGIAGYTWSFGDNTTASGAMVTHIYATTDLFRAIVTVTDIQGASSSADLYVEVDSLSIRHNVPPIVNMDITPTSGIMNQTQFFCSGENSFDSDGRITLYYWTFGDGSVAYGTNVSHIFADSGLFKISLAITDDSGAISKDVRYVWAWPLAPPHTVDTCWSHTITVDDMTARYSRPRVEAEIRNPKGEFYVRLTLKYKRVNPDVIVGIEFFTGERRIVFEIPDPYPGYVGEQTVQVVIPQKIWLELNQDIALTWQAGYQQNTVQLLKIEGCTEMFPSGH